MRAPRSLRSCPRGAQFSLGRPGAELSRAYFAVGIANSAPLATLAGQRCITLFCLV